METSRYCVVSFLEHVCQTYNKGLFLIVFVKHSLECVGQTKVVAELYLTMREHLCTYLETNATSHSVHNLILEDI